MTLVDTDPLVALARDPFASKQTMCAALAAVDDACAPEIKRALAAAVRMHNATFLKAAWRSVAWHMWAPALNDLLVLAVSLVGVPSRDSEVLCVRHLLYAIKMTCALEPSVDLGVPSDTPPVMCCERGVPEKGSLMLSNSFVVTFRVCSAPHITLRDALVVAIGARRELDGEFERFLTSTVTLSRGPAPLPESPPIFESARAALERALFDAIQMRRVGDEQRDDVAAAREILAKHHDTSGRSIVHVRDADGDTPLHRARTAEMATLLLEHGADIEARPAAPGPPKGFTPLLSACLVPFEQTPALARALLAHGAAIEARDMDGRTVVHWVAMMLGNAPSTLATARVLCNADPAAFARALALTSHYGETPLHLVGSQACNAFSTDTIEHVCQMIQMLIEAGANVAVRNDKDKTARDCAVERGADTKILALLACTA